MEPIKRRSSIASPKIMSKLSPLHNLANKNNINMNPNAQKNLLSYAVNRPKDPVVTTNTIQNDAKTNEILV